MKKEEKEFLVIKKSDLVPKFDSMARCIGRIESKIPFGLQQLEQDYDLQDILTTNVSRLIQLSVDIGTMIISRSNEPFPGDMTSVFSVLAKLGWISDEISKKMKKSVGLRNIMIHQYDQINWKIVHEVTHEHIVDIKNFVKQINSKIEA